MWANVARRAALRGTLRTVRYSTALSGTHLAPVSRTALPGDMRALSGSATRREEPKNGQVPIGEVEPKLRMSLTCAVPGCGTRSSHEFTKRSYTRGVVIVQCPGCQNRHLIADHLGWFTQSKDEPRTIEEIVRAKGGKIQRGTALSDGQGGETIEIEE